MAFDSIFPFLPSTAGTPPQLFPYDVVINTAFPGVEFIGTEPNAEYQEIREVNGNFWLVTNAMWNQNLLQWDQETNQNTTLPAYALELAADGSMTRYESPPTLIPDTPITWTPLWTVTGVGLMDSTPLEVTGVSDPMNQLQVTWDPGVGIAPTAREVDITDIASSVNSLLDNLVVNGVQVWTVNKEGVLIHGTVPASAIPGIFNNPTFTGTSIFTGPVVDTSTLTVDGSTTLNSTLFVVGSSTLDGGLTVASGETVTGGLTTDNLDVTGNETVHGTATFDGPAVFNNTVTFSSPPIPISSPDGSIIVTPVGDGYTIEDSGIGVGSTIQYGLNHDPSTTSDTFPIPGTASQMWSLSTSVIVELAAPFTGTLTISGAGSTTGGGSGWDAYSYTITNPTQTIITMSLVGNILGGETGTMLLTIVGGTINFINVNAIANRFF